MNPIKNWIKYIYYTLRDLAIPKSHSKEKANSLVILRMDAIGDYILFRNFIEVIATSSKYKNYSITLIGNSLWSKIAEELDKDWIHDFIWIDPNKFQKDFSYRKQKVKELRMYQYSLLFHPVSSRDYYVAESISYFIEAKEKVTVKGDTLNISSWQKKKSDKGYDFFLNNPENVRFEFLKNLKLIEDFLGTELHTIFGIDRSGIAISRPLQEKYILLFIGGSADFKKWSNKNWVDLIEKILSNYSHSIVLAGGPDDLQAGLAIKGKYKDEKRVINLCGKTTLLELITLISTTEWMISNETSAPHIAAAQGVPVLVLSNGNHYGRFLPYPQSVFDKHFSIFSIEIEEEENEDVLYDKYADGSDLSIDSIQVDAVFNNISKNLT